MEIEVQIKQKPFEEAVARTNVTYVELAEKLGVNRIYLSNVKNVKLPQFKPSGHLRKKLMEVLNVEFDEIFEVVNNKKSRAKK